MSRIFGAVTQNGYVVRDIHAALKHWIEVLGVGPWFLAEHVPFDAFVYRGEPSNADVAIALANSGALQIELIQQHNDAPSMYRDFLAAGREGLQHLAYWTDDIAGDLERALRLGYRIGQEGSLGGPRGRFVYLDTEAGFAGTVVELSDKSGPKGRMFRMIREASEGWDGRDPIRPLRRPE
jgi:hypothetical protein